MVAGCTDMSEGLVGSDGGETSGSENSIQINPQSVVVVLQGDIDVSSIPEELNTSIQNINKTEAESDTVTVLTIPSAQVDIQRIEDEFNNRTDFNIEDTYYGVDSEWESEFESSIKTLANSSSEVDAGTMRTSVSIKNDQQTITISFESDPTPVIPILPETEIRRVTESNGTEVSETEPLINYSHLDPSNGFGYSSSEGAVGQILSLYLNESGQEELRTAFDQIEEPSGTDLQLQLVINENPLESYGLSQTILDNIRSDSWDRNMRLPVLKEDIQPVLNQLSIPLVPFEIYVNR